jgi:poly(3-hydroxyalkanoate) depolymerase
MDVPAGAAPAPGAVRIAHLELDGRRIRCAVRPGDPRRVPLLIFNGLGANIEMALPFIDALRAPSVLIFDAPGVGGSPAPLLPYRPSAVARVGAALLEHLGHARADVLGVSWGGAIAQQFALDHATRCRRLVLAATSPGALMVPGDLSVLLKMATPRRFVDARRSPEVAAGIYGGRIRSDPELAARTLRHVRFASRRGYYLQLAAAAGWSSLPWLWLLRQPTLILAGTDDPVVPVLNARILQRLIRDARLELLDCGHLFLMTLAEESARRVDAFLTEP